MNPLRSLSPGRTDFWTFQLDLKRFSVVRQGGPSGRSTHMGWGNGAEGEGIGRWEVGPAGRKLDFEVACRLGPPLSVSALPLGHYWEVPGSLGSSMVPGTK